MTLEEVVNAALKQIQGVCGAMTVAGQNGRPIFLADGRPAPGLQPPPLGNVLLVILNAQSVLLQAVRHTAATLSGGFALSDQEAGRIADLIIEKMNAGKAQVETDVAVDLQAVQT